MKIKKAFILVKVDTKEGLRQVLLTDEESERFLMILNTGMITDEIKLNTTVIAEEESK